MDPPEEKNDRLLNDQCHYWRRAEDSHSEARYLYTLGDDGKPEDMAVAFKSAADQLWALSRLQPNDPCFILRSCGRFTFAKVLSRECGDGAIEVQVNDEGCTKTIPMIQCPKYIRLLDAPQAQHPSTKPKGHPAHQRGASWNAPKQMQRPTHQRRASITTSNPRELQRQSSLNFQPGRSRRPQSQLRRHASLNAGGPHRQQLQRRSSFFQSDNINDTPKQQPTSQNLHASFQSKLNKTHVQPARPRRRGTVDSGCNYLRSVLKRSSIITKEGSDRHVSWNLTDDAELSSVESDSDDSTVESSSSSSSFEEEEEPSPSPTNQQAPHHPLPRRKDVTKKDVHMLVESYSSSLSSDDSASPSPSPTDVKKVVHLSGFDIEFNEKSLVDAFRTISSKRR